MGREPQSGVGWGFRGFRVFRGYFLCLQQEAETCAGLIPAFRMSGYLG